MRVRIADDVDYYRRCREVLIKPTEMPQRYNTPVQYGCPYNCGLSTDHEQHSCLTLIEVCDFCNLRCPVCYASSGPDRQAVPQPPQIERGHRVFRSPPDLASIGVGWRPSADRCGRSARRLA